ncbi:MAG TPA: acyltransferase family protein [Vicinamibacterales bacterium]
MTYRPDIDGLRAVAVVPVVLFHAGIVGFSGGYVGVDVFFVISGYLITGILLNDLRTDSFSIWRFYERRIRRIFPALFSTLFVCAGLAQAIMLPEDFEHFGRSMLAVTFFVSNMLFAGQGGYFDRPVDEEPLLHTWSLAVEEQFYILFPICLFILWRLTRNVRQRGRVTLLVLVGSLLFSVWQVDAAPTDAFFLLPSRAWELLLGACLAIGFVPMVRSPRVHGILTASGLGLILWSVVAYTSATPFPGASALAPCLGAALIIYSGAGGDSAVRRLLSTGPFVFIGKISYSLYLWHWPLLVLGEYWLIRGLTLTERWIAVLLSVALATISLRYVEAPFRTRTLIATRKPVFAAGAALMAVAAGLGTGVVLGDGFPRRLPSDVERFIAGARDRPSRAAECNHRSAADVQQGNVCRLGAGDAGTPSFAVWGDSHAESYLTVLDEVAGEAGRSGLLLTRAGCPSLLDVSQARRPAYEEPCTDFGRAVVELLAAQPAIETVILSSRWTIYAIGERYGNEKGDPVYIRDSRTNRYSLAENRRVFEDGLQRTIAELRAMNKTVVIVAQVPEVGWFVPTALARVRMHDAPLNIAPTLQQYLDRQAFINAAFERAAREPGVRVLYPHEHLCVRGSCLVTVNGKSLYYDSNHLSVYGTRFLKEMFRGAFTWTHAPG